MASLTAKGPRQLIGTILQLFDRSLYALPGFCRNPNRSAQYPRNGHCADARQPRNVIHGGFSIDSRDPVLLLHFAR
jgi:hypothetical protein